MAVVSGTESGMKNRCRIIGVGCGIDGKGLVAGELTMAQTGVDGGINGKANE